MQTIILILANPFVVAFLLPFVMVGGLIFGIFQIEIAPVEVIGKQLSLPFGSTLTYWCSELIYNFLPGAELKARWAVWFVSQTPIDNLMLTAWLAINGGIIAGTLSTGWRWVSYFYAVQFQRQTLESDRKFMKQK